MSEATNPVATVRASPRADVPATGRLGALLVRMHHDFDPEHMKEDLSEKVRTFAPK